MPTTLFLQSEIKDPYKLYETMLVDSPVYWDETNRLWAIYSYEDCKSILNNDSAHIPEINPNNKDGLNEHALLMTGYFVRLSNGIHHKLARAATDLLFDSMKPVAINKLIERLLQNIKDKSVIDWVGLVCKNLPVIVTLKNFGFADSDCDLIVAKIEQLVKIMLPNKTQEQVKEVNDVSKEIYLIVKKHFLNTAAYKTIIKILSESYKTETDKIISLCISNLIGSSIIQGYDANRGMLSNSFLQILNNDDSLSWNIANKENLMKSIIETLRFDPPVHNTRRVAADNIALNNIVIKKGESIYIVLAAANRDPKQFERSNIFDSNRINNDDHLTFGSGTHACLAKHFSAKLATETLWYFLNRYKKIKLLEQEILYEPKINVRLPKRMLISLS
jgi:cytochrome P450